MQTTHGGGFRQDPCRKRQARAWNFLENFGRLSLVDKEEHGRLLSAAMVMQGADRQVIADATDVKPRTVTNWRSGATMPTLRQRTILREVLGPYDEAAVGGDRVVAAVKASDLTEDRQYDVIGFYKRKLREQREQEEGA